MSFNKEDMYLFFPQWEGSGKTNEIYRGATTLYQSLKSSIPFTEIEVESHHEPLIEQDIVGYAHILRYLQEVHHLLNTKKPQRIFTLGGDCGIEIAPISFLNKRYDGDLAVIWLDAHADVNTPQSSPSQTFHGMALRTLLGEGNPKLVEALFSKLLPRQIFLAGVRDLDLPEQQFIARKQIASFTCEQLTLHLDDVIDTIKNQGFSHAYLHIDVDVLDPLSFPYVKCPTPHGIAPETLQRMHQGMIESLSLVGCSIVELTPPGEGETQMIEQLASLYSSFLK
ncbi:MAG TPA: arginase family protein [Ktedonobacteraceae bacterium]|jgi:arginase|nr:arginase family protein [Ktedonobacteraceae bacterium]